MNRLLVCIFLTFTKITATHLRHKVDTCIHMTMVRTHNVNGIVDDIYECLIHSRILRVDYSVLDNHLHDIVANVTIARTNKDKKEKHNAKQALLWRQKLKRVQSDTVLLFMRLRHYSTSLTIPKFTNMNTDRVLKTVDHFATELLNTVGHVSELRNQIKPCIETLGNMTLDLSELDRLAKCEDTALHTLENALVNLKTIILSLYD